MKKLLSISVLLSFSLFIKSEIPVGASTPLQSENSIATIVTDSSICTQTSIIVDYVASGEFDEQNSFIAQLSDQYGNFSAPITIGEVQASSSGSIIVEFPASLKPSKTYRIRVVSTSPAVTGSDNGFDIAIGYNVTPAIKISTISTKFCPGDTVTFEAEYTYGGHKPTFIWKINDVTQWGPSSKTFKTTSLNNGDKVHCDLVTNIGCATQFIVSSNAIYMYAETNAVPMISIKTQRQTFCVGSEVIFHSFTRNAGENPIYDWKINNISTGITTHNFKTTTLKNGDVVSCDLVSSMTCANPRKVSSNNIVMDGRSPQFFYKDHDKDGYGNDTIFKFGCIAPPNYVLLNGDCDDRDRTVYPNAPELADGKDNNCNGLIDEDVEDVVFNISDVQQLESSQTFVFTVSVDKVKGQRVTIDYRTMDSTASSDDYRRKSGTLEFGPGKLEKKIAIQVFDDNIPEPTEIFKVVLRNPSIGRIEKRVGYGTIIDDDSLTAFSYDRSKMRNSKQINVKISPNPTKNVITVYIEGIYGNVDFNLFDILGKVVFRKKMTFATSKEFKIDIPVVGSVRPGNYFLTIIDQNGNRVTKQVIIEK